MKKLLEPYPDFNLLQISKRIIYNEEYKPLEIQLKLLANILTDNYKSLIRLLATESVNINYFFEIPYKQTALEIACVYESLNCVQILIEKGANVEQALDSAVQSGNLSILSMLLDDLNNKCVYLHDKLTIIDLIKFINKFQKQEEDYTEVLKLLINNNFNVNVLDGENFSAINLAAQYRYKKFIEILLQSEGINLDNTTNTGLTARQLIISNNLYHDKLPYDFKQRDLSDRSILDQNIRQKNEIEFISNYIWIKPNIMKRQLQKNYESDKTNENYDIRYIYFCKACASGLVTVVKYLLCDGVKFPCFNTDKTETPLYLACLNGYYKIVDIVLEYSDASIISFTFVQLLAMRSLKNENICNNVNFKKCFDIILQNNHLDVNYCLTTNTNQQLEGKTALYFALKKQHVDIVFEILRKGASLVYLCPWEVKIDANILIEYLNESIKPNIQNNLTTIHLAALLPSENDKDEPELKFIEYLGKNPDLHQVLHHPIIQILLNIKWKTVRTYYDINLILFVMFSITLHIYLNTKNNTENKNIIMTFYTLIIIFYVILLIRELIQVYIYRKEYFFSYDNYIEIGILSITARFIFTGVNDYFFIQLYAILILLSGFEIILLIGRLTPVLFISISVLIKCAKLLFKWLLPYLVLILAFTCSFYLLFRTETTEVEGTIDTTQNETAFKDFQDSFLRTLVMLTGEFNIGELQFESYPVLSPIFFIFYVFFMNTVLFGVCSAIAFGETQLIMKNAEVATEIYRIKHIVHWEYVLRKNRSIQKILKIEKLFKKNYLIIKITNGSKVYITNNPDPYKNIRNFLPHYMHFIFEMICRDDLPYIINLEKNVVKRLKQLINTKENSHINRHSFLQNTLSNN